MQLNNSNETGKNYLKDREYMNYLMSTSINTNIALIAMGILNNSLCVYSLSQKIMRKYKYNYYLLLMAIFELIYCLVLFVDYLFFL